MGTNSSQYDVVAEYEKKTLNDLLELRDKFQSAVVKHPTVKMFNEHLEFIKLCIAERIGKKR